METIQGRNEEDNVSLISFLSSQFNKMKHLSSSLMLHYGSDLTLFDGFHTPVSNELQSKAIQILSKLFIILECFDFEVTFIRGIECIIDFIM